MTDRARTVKGMVELSVGEALGFGANFIRYLILARLLGKTAFGTAATLALTVQILQTVSNMALNMLIVQSKAGDSRSLQATAHSFQILRGLVNAGLILALAWPISALFGVPEARWAYQWLALVPLLDGFIHLDTYRMERRMQFWPGIAVAAIPKGVAAVAAWPLAAWFKDYSAMLWLLIAQSTAALVVSHLLAKRPYHLGREKRYIAEILQFGWPLLLNGMLFFGISQGDRFIVGALYGMADLGVYYVSAGLVVTLGAALSKVMNTVMLPPLSRAQEDAEAFLSRYRGCARAFALVAGLYGPLLIVAGEPLIVFFYGEQYRAAGVLVAWLAAAQSIRLLRLGPSLAAAARADTKCLMYANVFRISGVVAAATAAFTGADLYYVAAAAVAGEAIAFPIPLLRLSRRHNLPVAACLRPASAALAGVGLSGLLVAVAARDTTIVIVSVAALLLLAGVFVLGVVTFSSSRGRFTLTSAVLWLGGDTDSEGMAAEPKADRQ